MHNEANRFSREISSFFDAYFEEEKLATSYIEILLMINEAGSANQKWIAEKMDLAPSTITRFIHRLEKLGIVKKEVDGRMAKISLTKKGLKMAPALGAKYEKAESDLKELLGEKFVDTTRQLLDHGSEIIQKRA